MLCKVSMQHPTYQCLGPLVLLISPPSCSLPLAETSHHLAPLPLNAWEHPLSKEDQLRTKHVEKEKSEILLRGTAQSAAKEVSGVIFKEKKETTKKMEL